MAWFSGFARSNARTKCLWLSYRGRGSTTGFDFGTRSRDAKRILSKLTFSGSPAMNWISIINVDRKFGLAPDGLWRKYNDAFASWPNATPRIGAHGTLRCLHPTTHCDLYHGFFAGRATISYPRHLYQMNWSHKLMIFDARCSNGR